MSSSRIQESPPRRGRPPRLSRKRVLDAALRLVRRRGAGALTMRGLADALGVGPMTLYGHVRDKRELLDAVGALALDRLDVAVPDTGAWTERLAAWMRVLHDRLLEHPEMNELIARQQSDSPALLRALRVPVRVLREAGFEHGAAVRAAQGLLWAAIGIFFVESVPTRYPRSDAVEDQLAAALQRVPDDERAEAATLVPHLVQREGDARALYAATVDRLIGGLEAELRAVEPTSGGGDAPVARR